MTKENNIINFADGRNSYIYRFWLATRYSIMCFLIILLLSGAFRNVFASLICIALMIISILLLKKKAKTYIIAMNISGDNLSLKYLNYDDVRSLNISKDVLRVQTERDKSVNAGYYCMKVFIDNELVINQYQIGSWTRNMMNYVEAKCKNI